MKDGGITKDGVKEKLIRLIVKDSLESGKHSKGETE